MIKQFKADRLTVSIYEDRKQMGTAAVEMVVERIQNLLQEKAFINIIFAAAPSQTELLAGLSAAKLDWSRVQAFHMDEYIGLPDDAPQRFGNFLKQHLFQKLPFKKVFYLDGSADDPEAECRRYGDLLREYPADLVCMGIGENGHLAFNDPPVADFQDPLPVKVVELDPVCRQQQVNDGCFNHLQEVPLHALTLTIPALMLAPYVYCVVPGPSKSRAVFNTLHQEMAEEYPSTILRSHAHAFLFLDQQSASLL